MEEFRACFLSALDRTTRTTRRMWPWRADNQPV